MSRFRNLAFKTLCGGIVILVDYSTIVVAAPVPGISAFSDLLGGSVAAGVRAPA
jgi:hypothetical protein